MPRSMQAGHATFWQALGSGPRRALAIHCGLAHSGEWLPVATALEGKLALTAFDLPGHGQSEVWEGQEDYLTQSTKIAGSFFEEPMDLIGHSFGAVVALRLALAAPMVVRSLTLIEPILMAAARGYPEYQTHVEELAPFVRAMENRDREAAAEAFTALWGSGVAWESLTEKSRAYAAERVHLIAAGAPGTVDDEGGILAPGMLETLALPVMIIRGSASPSVIGRIAQVIGDRLPDVGIAEVPGAGHMLPVTHPKQVAGLIEVNVSRGSA